MSNLITSMTLVLQIIMAVGLGVLIFRNGRNGATYQVASEISHPYKLAAAAEPIPDASRLYVDVPADVKLLELDKEALENAYRAQLLSLWTVWLKGQAGDPTYFANGLRIARRAYTQAAEQISKREQELRGSAPGRTDERR